MVHQVMETFSRRFVKEHLLEAVLELASDPVPNIRLRVCPLLPKLKVRRAAAQSSHGEGWTWCGGQSQM